MNKLKIIIAPILMAVILTACSSTSANADSLPTTYGVFRSGMATPYVTFRSTVADVKEGGYSNNYSTYDVDLSVDNVKKVYCDGGFIFILYDDYSIDTIADGSVLKIEED